MSETKEKVRIAINPPPSDGNCECCGKNVNDLKAFGGAGDPLVGDFTGAKLVKTFRSMGGSNKTAEDKIAKIEAKLAEELGEGNWDKFEELLIKEYGEQDAQNLMFYMQIRDTVSASWECRDCIILNSEDYHKKRRG